MFGAWESSSYVLRMRQLPRPRANMHFYCMEYCSKSYFSLVPFSTVFLIDILLRCTTMTILWAEVQVSIISGGVKVTNQ
jgi:hypothetical protein